MCREIQMGVAAAQLALSDAGLKPGDYDCERTGVVYGSDYIMTLPEEFTEGIRKCVDAESQFHFSRWAESGLPKVTPLWLLKYLPNMPASHIAIYNDLRGPNNSITLREASSNLAVTEAFGAIRRGSAERVIAGATGTRIHPLRTVHVLLQEQVANDEQAPRPFDSGRSGSVLGEGAGAIILEELESAQARGATILAEIVGYASSTVLGRDGHARLGQAVENVLRRALQHAGVRADEVGHVHAHGLGTMRCDEEEAQAIQRVFADRGKPVPVIAGKSYFGNLGAASGIVETIASLLALRHASLFPILHYETPDPKCPIHSPELGSDPGELFINVNVSPQGQASAVVARRFDG